MRSTLKQSSAAAVLAALLGASPGLAGEPADREDPRDRERPVRSWSERVKTGDAERGRRVDVVFDYEAGVARRRVYDDAGALVSDEKLSGTHPRPSAQEIAEAFALVRGDEELGGLLRETRGHLDGGFILAQERGLPCGPGTRCLQVFLLSESRREVVRHSVVDLMRREIVYRSYRPPQGRQ